MTSDLTPNIKASRLRVPRTRGALGGLLLLVLGAWAALAPFIGPSFDLAYTPLPQTSWHWTAARGLLELLPGAAAFLGGLLLLFSRSRLVTGFGAWLGVAAGAWLIIGPVVAEPAHLHLGTPDPTANTATRTLAALLFFYATGAAILFVASLALGRLSVQSIRDVRAAQRRAAEEQALEDKRRQEIEREIMQRRQAEARTANEGATPPQSAAPAQPVDPAYRGEHAPSHAATNGAGAHSYPPPPPQAPSTPQN